MTFSIRDIQHNDTQHNDIQHNNTQHKGLICEIVTLSINDTQHKTLGIECIYTECR